jgi:DNA-binding IclR family transcriptional regulator
VVAAGKAILAYLPEHEEMINRLRESVVCFYASGRPISAEKLRDELVEIRRQGLPSATCSVGTPELRFDLALAAKHGPLVREVAEKISLRMGNRFPQF